LASSEKLNPTFRTLNAAPAHISSDLSASEAAEFYLG
jgi:hypothetical protein